MSKMYHSFIAKQCQFLTIGHYIVTHGTIASILSATARYRVPVSVLNFQRSTNVSRCDFDSPTLMPESNGSMDIFQRVSKWLRDLCVFWVK